MGGTPRGRKLPGRRCSKGSSGAAIPCQPKPLKRTQWAGVTLELVPWPIPGLARPSCKLGAIVHRCACRSLLHFPTLVAATRHSRFRSSSALSPRPGLVSDRPRNPGLARPGNLPDQTQPERERQTTLDSSARLVTAELTVPPRPVPAGRGLAVRRSYRRARLHCVQDAAAMIAAPSSETAPCHTLGGMVATAMPWTA